MVLCNFKQFNNLSNLNNKIGIDKKISIPNPH